MVEAPSQQVQRARTGGSKALLRSFFGCRARNGRGESERVTGGLPGGPRTCPAVNRKLETVLVRARIAPTQPGRKPPRSVPDRVSGEDRQVTDPEGAPRRRRSPAPSRGRSAARADLLLWIACRVREAHSPLRSLAERRVRQVRSGPSCSASVFTKAAGARRGMPS